MHDDTDFEFEENDEEGGESQLKDKLKKLRQDLKKAHEEKQEHLTSAQRLKADFVNLTRRTEEEKRNLVQHANEGLLEDLLPVLDSFENALSGAEEGAWKDGVTRIYTQFLSVLRQKGVTEISEVGVPVDPRFHESLQTVSSSEEILPHHVAHVLQKGYRLGDRVLRAAKVAVAE